ASWLTVGALAYLAVNVRQLFLQHAVLRSSVDNRIAAETQAREVSETLGAIPGHVALIDAERGVYVSSNNYLSGQLFPGGDVVGNRVGTIETSPALGAAFDAFLKGDWDVDQQEIELAARWWLLTLRKTHLTGSLVLLVLMDITDRKESERQLTMER